MTTAPKPLDPAKIRQLRRPLERIQTCVYLRDGFFRHKVLTDLAFATWAENKRDKWTDRNLGDTRIQFIEGAD